MFTILIGVWELTYIRNYKKIRRLGMKFLSKKKHFLTNNYSINTLIPSKLGIQLYAEYAAYADREYYYLKDYIFLLINGSYGIKCGLFSFLGIISYAINCYQQSLMFVTFAMASQFMNTLLYICEYVIQINDRNSVNYDTERFPCGRFLLKRPFIWINFFWLAMPTYVISKLLS